MVHILPYHYEVQLHVVSSTEKFYLRIPAEPFLGSGLFSLRVRILIIFRLGKWSSLILEYTHRYLKYGTLY